jgi:flavodoxin
MTVSKQLLIYYFSGTGNAKQVAKWVSEVAIEKKIPVEVIDFPRI